MVDEGLARPLGGFAPQHKMPALPDLTLGPKAPAFVGVGCEVGLAHFTSAAGDVDGLRLVRAGAVLAAAAGDVNGLRLVLAGAAGEVDGPSLDSSLTWDVFDDVNDLESFLTSLTQSFDNKKNGFFLH